MFQSKTDEELMLAYQLGDENAFRELYARHSGRVMGFLRGKLRSEAAARDVFQATFLKLHKSRSRYNANLPFVPWLFTICRSELLDSLKKERRLRENIVAEVPEVAAPGPNELHFPELPDPQKRALELRYLQDSSFEDIAKAFETSPANARQIVSRAVRAMRSLYGKK